MLRIVATSGLVALGLQAPALAQFAFVPRESVARATPIAFDTHRQRAVMFGGRNGGTDFGYGFAQGGEVSGQTWEWDGQAWGERQTTRAPSPRANHALTYDAARQRVVLFGGTDGQTEFNETWEWDGVTWTQRAPFHGPLANQWHAMTYDSRRSRVVWVAYIPRVFASLTCEWDGNMWLLRATGGPPQLISPALTFDPTRGKCVLVGTAYGSRGEVWEWDGTSWTGPTRFPGTAAFGAAMTYDPTRRRVVMFGGDAPGSNPVAELWEYDGASWLQRVSAPGPFARARHGLTYDPARQRVLMFGGAAGRQYPGQLGDTWEWDGNTWTARAEASAPVPRAGHVFAEHVASGRCLAFGTFGGTWLWDGRTWTPTAVGASPPEREGAAMAYDSARGRLVLFGGNVGIFVSRDTHEWDGQAWHARPTNIPPPGQTGHAMAYHAARQRTVLFGTAGETWEWDGNTWLPVATTNGPSARSGHALAYDAVRQRTVLFGGANGPTLDDTWEWDGLTWTRVTPTRRPPHRHAHAMAFDAGRRQVVLFGGHPTAGYDATPLDDAWGFDGVTWTQIQFAATPPARGRSAMTYDTTRGHLLLDGGLSGAAPQTRLFTGPNALTPHAVAQVASVGSGCGTVEAPRLLTFNLPRVDTVSFALDLEAAPPNAPCTLALATRAAATALPGGCVLRVDPASLLVSSPAITSPRGTTRWRLPLQSNSLRGVTLHAQAFALDAGSLLGIAMSQGVEVRAGD